MNAMTIEKINFRYTIKKNNSDFKYCFHTNFYYITAKSLELKIDNFL